MKTRNLNKDMATDDKYSSFFVPDTCIFGSYPTQERAEAFLNRNVRYFVDLTTINEVKRYNLRNTYYINYPIPDRKIPTDISTFCPFLFKLVGVIKALRGTGEKIYIHCRGGHGRAGIVVACLLFLLYPHVNTTRALELTNEYHNNREIMKQKYREIGSPQNKTQRLFVHKLFSDMIYYRAFKKGPSYGFSNYSFHNVIIPENNEYLPVGEFPTSQAAYEAAKDINNLDHIQKQKMAKNPRLSKKISSKIITSEYFKENKYRIMQIIVELKVKQHPEILNKLQYTGFRRILFNNRTDNFFGNGDGNGANLLGLILETIRNKHYRKKLPNFIYQNS